MMHKTQVTWVTKFCVVAHNICGSSSGTKNFDMSTRFLENMWTLPEDGGSKFSEMSLIHESKWHHVPEDWNLHQHCSENLRSQKFSSLSHVSMPLLFGTVAKTQLCVLV